MVASLGESILQEIPLINYSDKDWTIKAQLTNENPKILYFNGPREFVVKKKYVLLLYRMVKAECFIGTLSVLYLWV